MASNQRMISQTRLPLVYFLGLPTNPQLVHTLFSIFRHLPFNSRLYIRLYDRLGLPLIITKQKIFESEKETGIWTGLFCGSPFSGSRKIGE